MKDLSKTVVYTQVSVLCGFRIPFQLSVLCGFRIPFQLVCEGVQKGDVIAYLTSQQHNLLYK